MGVGGQPHAPAAYTTGKDPVPIVQEAGWAPGPVWTSGKSRPHRDSMSDRPARSQSIKMHGMNVKMTESIFNWNLNQTDVFMQTSKTVLPFTSFDFSVKGSFYFNPISFTIASYSYETLTM